MRIIDWSSTCALPISGSKSNSLCGAFAGGATSSCSPSSGSRRMPPLAESDSSEVDDSRFSAGTSDTPSDPADALSDVVEGGAAAFGVADAGAAIAGSTVQSSFDRRSEEHTSELQSLMRISYAVFCLKKNKNNTTS